MYVILHPSSNSNHTDKFCVVDADAWSKYVNGAGIGFAIVSRHDTYRETTLTQAKLNKEANR